MARGGGGAQGKIENTYCQYDKVGCVFTMIIWSEFHTGEYRDDDHREDAPHFSRLNSETFQNFHLEA